MKLKKLYNERIPLTISKWNDLQKLKTVLPRDVHYFYDNLPQLKNLKKRNCTEI